MILLNGCGCVNLRPSRSVGIAKANQPQRFQLASESPNPMRAIESQGKSPGAFPPSSGRSARMPLNHRSNVLKYDLTKSVDASMTSNTRRISELKDETPRPASASAPSLTGGVEPTAVQLRPVVHDNHQNSNFLFRLR